MTYNYKALIIKRLLKYPYFFIINIISKYACNIKTYAQYLKYRSPQ